jgi:16S rRNA (guanine527-N7)-methyltransferase
MSTAREALLPVLEDARAAGFLGPGPVGSHLDHAFGFAAAVESARGRPPESFVDLGTGGGVPGLVLALRWTGARGVFLDSSHRRCVFLLEATERLGIAERVDVVEQRGETVGRDDRYREQFEVVSARSFAGPAVTAEIAAGLVRVGGVLVVSEPPDGGDRWSISGLAEVGFGPAQSVELGGAHYVVVRKEGPVPAKYPRAVGRPGKRPIW